MPSITGYTKWGECEKNHVVSARSLVGCTPARPGVVNGTALERLTGGTGRFRCAAGFAPFTLEINTATLTEVITFER